ncbi:MAG: metallophosphoesterase [Planctomycetaceae bacterium]|nr:metallophosphoesterase [Planctomycetaceae bacterium]
MNTAIGLAILMISCIGNAELWVIMVNRRHSLQYRHHTLRQIRKLHDIGLTAYPPLILLIAGLRPGGLLRGGHFVDLPGTVQWLIGTTFLGFVSFVVCVVRYQLRRPPAGYRLLNSTIYSATVDGASADVGTAPHSPHATTDRRSTAGGPSTSRLSRLPFNQIRQLEVNTKQFPLRSGPAGEQTAAAPLRLVHFTDVHLVGCPERAHYEFATERMLELSPDAFLFTGDLLDDMRLLPTAVDLFARMATVAPCYFILGNHDWHLEYREIRHRIADTGWIDVADRTLVTKLGPWNVRLAGTEAPWMGGNPSVPDRRDAEEDVRLLLSHAPDQRNYAADNDFDLMLCGHNHGGQVVLPVIGPIYSPSCYGVRYAGGAFRYRSLLMHVSRGLGARDPLRWNCRPEVSLLELSAPSGRQADDRPGR